MNKRQIIQLNSCQSIQLELQNGALIWENHGKFKDNVEQFLALLEEIFKYKNLQAVVIDAARIFKQKAREEMAFKSIKIRSAVQNYASDIGDEVLYASINIQESALLYKRQQDSISLANLIESIAREQLANLGPYFVVLADVDGYKESIENFQGAIPMVNELINERKNATAKLKELYKEMSTLIRTKLKKGATQFMISAPDFYKKLIYCLTLKNMPKRFTEFEMLMTDKLTNEALSGVKVTATSGTKTMMQFSNPIGEVDFKQFESGYWNLTFELPGYNVLHKNNVKAELGKKLYFGKVELVKVV